MIAPHSFSFFMLTCVGVLLSLGTWQLYRKEEKETLIQTMQTHRALPAQNVDEKGDILPFQPLIAQGTFIPNQMIFLLSKTHQGKAGKLVLHVLRTQGGQYLLVQRGWTQEETVAFPQGQILLEGTARVPTPPTLFQPPNTPPSYFWIDLVHLSKEICHPLLPYYMVAKTSSDPAILPLDPLPTLPNNHLQYALTWYGLACVVLFMLFYRNKILKT